MIRDRWKMLLAAAAAIGGLCVILYGLAQGILLPDYVDLERSDMTQHVERVRDAMLNEVQELSRQLNDWAAWDETYAFVARPSREYVTSNLPVQTFQDLGLDAVAILDRPGTIVYGQGYDRSAAALAPLSPAFRALLTPASRLLRHTSTESEVRGIILLPTGPWLVASRPILTSERAGPIRGTMIWGREFSAENVSRLAKTTHLQVATEILPSLSAAGAAMRGVPRGQIAVQAVGDRVVRGSTILPDISGRPALRLSVTQPRTIVAQGRASITYFILSFLVIGLAFGALAVSLYDRLSASRRAREQSEERFKALADQASPLAIFAVDVSGRIQTWNPAAERLFGWKGKEVLQKEPPMVQVAGGDAYRSLLVQIRDNGEPTEIETVLRKRDGAEIVAAISATALRAPNGAIEGMMVVVTDITARKESAARIERQLRRMAALRMIDTAITASLELRVTLEVLLDQVTTQLGVDAATILLFDQNTQRLNFGAGRGFRTRALQYSNLRLGEGHAGIAALERRLVHVADLRADPGGLGRAPRLADEAFMMYYAVPLIAKGEVKGVLEVFHRQALAADTEWIGFLEALASQAAIAIDSSALFEHLQRANMELTLAYDATLEGWSRALDLRDEETEGHTQRVTELTLQLAQSMGVSEDQLVHIRRGALLHDIGKMGIPDAVLLKPGPLTVAEREIIERHPTYAYALLSPIPYLRKSLDIPYCHHEKWDGTGYPRGLSGENIPLPARIFAVVDVWDALTSDRPYRPAWSSQAAMDYITQQSGRHFEPAIVNAFVHLLTAEGEPAGSRRSPP